MNKILKDYPNIKAYIETKQKKKITQGLLVAGLSALVLCYLVYYLLSSMAKDNRDVSLLLVIVVAVILFIAYGLVKEFLRKQAMLKELDVLTAEDFQAISDKLPESLNYGMVNFTKEAIISYSSMAYKQVKLDKIKQGFSISSYNLNIVPVANIDSLYLARVSNYMDYLIVKTVNGSDFVLPFEVVISEKDRKTIFDLILKENKNLKQYGTVLCREDSSIRNYLQPEA